MILLDKLTKRFGAQTAVDALSLEIPAGQIVGFLGPNGAGKSTTLKMLTGMIEPTSGRASICGHDLQREPVEVKRDVGFVPESGAVFESLTGLEYLEMVAALYGIPPNAARARIKQFIAFFDLSFETLTDKLLGAYSKGMRRKVVITSALLHNPPGGVLRRTLGWLGRQCRRGLQGAHPDARARGQDHRLQLPHSGRGRARVPPGHHH
jgi:ABC-2 type transport system ATP-binding protein